MQDIVIQQPSSPRTLVLLFHGYGADAQDLAPVGELLAQARPGAWVVSVNAPMPCEAGFGWQWMPVQGATDANRVTRVAAAMPAFQQSIKGWQSRAGLPDAQTVLLGFSQGAMMSLAYTQVAAPLQVLALSGRFVPRPTRINPNCSIHLMHGQDDDVIAAQCSQDAATQLQDLGAVHGQDLSLDILSGLGHGIDERVMRRVLGVLHR